MWREADWKKAYVIFAPPPGVLLPSLRQQAAAGEQEQELSMIDQLRKARGLPPRGAAGSQLAAGDFDMDAGGKEQLVLEGSSSQK